MNPILRSSGIEQARLIRGGEISAEELIRAHLEHIRVINPRLNAVVEALADSALAAGRRADTKRMRGEHLRPFEGVPFSVKDSIEVEGAVCSAGTTGFRNRARFQSRGPICPICCSPLNPTT